MRKSYPSKLNQLFFFRRIDAGFISSIAGYRAHLKNMAMFSGIIANGAVWSVLLLKPNNSSLTLDYQSASSNALSAILGLGGRVLIGDCALREHYKKHKGATKDEFIDLGEVWKEKTRLPFVFGRLCCNNHRDLYNNISKAFNATNVKIPHYMLISYALHSNIPATYIKEYLKHIYYNIGHKELVSLKRFYRAARLKQHSFPKRIYPNNNR